jgi:hypothetical protein
MQAPSTSKNIFYFEKNKIRTPSPPLPNQPLTLFSPLYRKSVFPQSSHPLSHHIVRILAIRTPRTVARFRKHIAGIFLLLHISSTTITIATSTLFYRHSTRVEPPAAGGNNLGLATLSLSIKKNIKKKKNKKKKKKKSLTHSIFRHGGFDGLPQRSSGNTG